MTMADIAIGIIIVGVTALIECIKKDCNEEEKVFEE